MENKNANTVTEGVKNMSVAKKSGKRMSKAQRKIVKRMRASMGAAAFIRSLPATMKAKDVVAAAKRRGFTVAMSYVYNVRLAARKKSGKKTVGKALPASNAAGSGDSAFRARAMELAGRFIDDLTDCLMQSIRSA
jgi:hypothetical protein